MSSTRSYGPSLIALSWLVTAMALFAMPLQAQDLGCSDDVTLDGLTIEVAASSSGDDTENIQCALQAGADNGYREILLTSDEYAISSVFVDNFTGDLRGKAAGDAPYPTVVRVLDGSVDCAEGQSNAVFGFSNGDARVRYMAVEVGSPCIEPSSISVVGFYTDPQNCSQRTTFGRADRMTITGLGLSGADVVSGVTMDTALGCDQKLLGAFTVNRVDFTGLEYGILSSATNSAKLSVTFNEFVSVGLPVTIVEANQTTTIQRNDIYYNDVSGYSNGLGTVGVFIASTGVCCTKNASFVRLNKFYDGGASSSGIGVLVGEFDNTIDHSLIIIANDFNGNSAATEGVGIAAIDTSGGLVSTNSFRSDMGVWLDIQSGDSADGFPGSTVVGWAITNNSFGAADSDPVDIRFGDNTSGNVVGSAQGGPQVEDLSGGLNDDLTEAGASAWYGAVGRTLPGEPQPMAPASALLSVINATRFGDASVPLR